MGIIKKLVELLISLINYIAPVQIHTNQFKVSTSALQSVLETPF